jgi:hypothetical protein
MNKKINIIFFFSILTLLFSFGKDEFKDDLIELSTSINARLSPEFLKSNSSNIRAQLPKGTKGVVLKSQKMPSGNYGLYLKISNGPHQGEDLWVYYNKSDPALLLSDKHRRETKVIERATNAVTKREIASLIAPQAVSISPLIQNIEEVNSGKVSKELSNPKLPCKPNYSLSDAKIDYNESMNIPPFKEIDETSDHSCRSGESPNGYQICKTKEGKIEQFSFKNNGPNNIIKKSSEGIERKFEFNFCDHARSDLNLLVIDAPDENTHSINYNIFVFLPRLVLPSIKKIDSNFEVTLPNKEKMIFNANSKEIVGGVFTERPQSINKRGNANPIDLTYSGNGVVIRSSKNGDLPYGDIEKKDGSRAPSISKAYISKKGFKDCEVDAKDIWYTDSQRGNKSLIKKEFASDEQLDKFIKSHCGFSIY